MPRTHSINASEMFEPVEVIMWDKSKFRLREAVISVEDKVEAKQKEINTLSSRGEPLELEANSLRQEILALEEGDPNATKRVRELADRLREKQKEIDAESEAIEKDILPLLIEMLDILLEPMTEVRNEAGEVIMVPSKLTKQGKPAADSEEVPKMITAGDSINASLKEDKIGVTHINALSKKLNETALEARPT